MVLVRVTLENNAENFNCTCDQVVYNSSLVCTALTEINEDGFVVY
jgi:hypothetical protein